MPIERKKKLDPFHLLDFCTLLVDYDSSRVVMDEHSVAEQEQHKPEDDAGRSTHNGSGQQTTSSVKVDVDDAMQVDTLDAEQDATTSTIYTAVLSLQGHKGSVSSLAISPDGQYLASSGVDGLLKIWTLATGKLIATLDAALASDEDDETARLRLGLSDVAWSRDGQYLVSGGDDCIVRVWDANRVSPSHQMASNRFHPNGFILYTPLQHSLVRQFSGHTSYVFCVNFHPNTSLAVSGSFDESVRLWNLQRNTCHRVISAHSEAVTAVDFNIDGSILASSSYDGQIRLWDSTTGQCLKTLLSEGENKSIGIGDIKFSPNSFQILATSLDHTIRLWDIANSRVVKTYFGHQNEKFAIKACFTTFEDASASRSQRSNRPLTSPPLMIVAGSENNRIHLWDLQSRKVIQTLAGHKDVVTSIATHPSRHVIASASLDRDPTIKVSAS